jgi:hypothetical protein
MVAHGDDGADLTGTAGAGNRERDQLGARPTGEVIEIHARERPPVRRAYGRSHRVHPVLVRAGVGVCIDGRSSQIHQLPLIVGQVTGRRRECHAARVSRAGERSDRTGGRF